MTLQQFEIDKEDDASSRHDHRSTSSRAAIYLGIALLFLFDRILHFTLHNITSFPTSLIGMAIILITLIILRHNDHRHDISLHHFFTPSLDWITHKWLPVFYSPALITLPLALLPLNSSDLIIKSVLVISIGIVATAFITGHVAQLIRKIVSIEYIPVRREQHKSDVQFSYMNFMLWICIGCISFVVLVVLKLFDTMTIDDDNNSNIVDDQQQQQQQYSAGSIIYASSIFLFLLSTTILGYIFGMHFPDSLKKVIHPMLMCAILPNIAAIILSIFIDSNLSYYDILRIYLTKGKNQLSFWPLDYGPGDLLFTFLPIIILSFGFKVYEEYDVLQRHTIEVLCTTATAAAFTMLSTALLSGRMVCNLPPPIARALVPRGATLALAIPIAERLDAPTQLTAAAVALTGILGGNFIQFLMTIMKFTDPMSRGLTAAGTAHGLGTAAMAAKEPEALPFAGLSYALCGVFASLFATLPWFRSTVLWLTG